jgi:hypothetical protein
MNFRMLGALSVAAGLTLAGAPALALDDTSGTWEGKISCKGSNQGVATKTKGDLVLQVDEGKGIIVRMTVNGTPFGIATLATTIDDTTKLDRGRMAGLDCESQVFTFVHQVLAAEVVIKPGTEKGTMKGSVNALDGAAGTVDVCTFNAKRTSAVHPDLNLDGCPS